MITLRLTVSDCLAQYHKSRSRAHGEYRYYQWLIDGIYQLQRLAFEPAGVQDWQRTDSEIPITRDNFPLIILDDRARPTLSQLKV